MNDDDRTLLQDDDRTLRMPAPGGHATVVLPRRSPRPTQDLQRRVEGVNPLLEAAGTLLSLAPRLRATTEHSDPAALREHLLARVAEFETAAAAAGVQRPRIGAARYLLCSFLDEVVEGTPWGHDGVWARRNLLQAFHDERWGGAKAFELLERLLSDPPANVDLLELFDVCLSLGYEGPHRGRPDARERLGTMAARVQAAVRAVRPPMAPERVLSLRTAGIDTRGRGRLSQVPLWVAAALAAFGVTGIAVALDQRLAALSAPAFRDIHAIASALRIDRAAALAPPRLAAPLQPVLAGGAIAVRDEAQRSVVTLPADTAFAAGTARTAPAAAGWLDAVAAALKATPGEVTVSGHDDDRHVASLQFPSAWHLTRTQAEAVVAELQRRGVPASRLRAEGRADAQPLQPNDTPEARRRNRRVEIELRLPRPEGA